MNNCQYIEGLQSLYKVAGKCNENTDLGITRESYRQGFCLIGFEVDPTSLADFQYIGKHRSGRTRIALRFHKSLQKTITVIVYATFPDLMLIDRTRAVSLYEKDKLITRVRGRGS